MTESRVISCLRDHFSERLPVCCLILLFTTFLEAKIARFYILGKYSVEAIKGFVANPDQDRSKAAQSLITSIGATLIGMSLLRGPYDFIAIIEGTTDQAAAGKMILLSSGSTRECDIREAVDYSGPAALAQRALSAYKPPQSA